LDETDFKIISRMMHQGRITWSELGSTLGLSAPAAADRVRRLEEKGVIKGYAALVDPEAAGCGLTAFIAVTLDRPEHRPFFLKLVQETAEIQECHHITGEEDYLLKVRCSGIKGLEQLVSDRLKGIPGLARTRTTIALSTIKESASLPLAPGSGRVQPPGKGS
jgi:Lrp/AsnC family leucine-responsive transcriptional regulator